MLQHRLLKLKHSVYSVCCTCVVPTFSLYILTYNSVHRDSWFRSVALFTDVGEIFCVNELFFFFFMADHSRLCYVCIAPRNLNGATLPTDLRGVVLD